MGRGFANGVVFGQLQTLLDDGAVGTLPDGELLGRFLDERGEAGEAAFGALVRRHGPLVFGVCRRALRDADQAEDAFQATFLVLAAKARSIRNHESVGPWLGGVAAKIAARARGDALRRRAHEARAAGLAPAWSTAGASNRDEVAALLEEIGRLRRPLREAVVLCHLQGLTYASAAGALGVPEGTIRGRLARAKEALRDRLGRRGFARDSSALVPLTWPDLTPARVVASTIRGSMAVAAGRAATGIVPGSAITLMEGALRNMLTAKLKTAALLALGAGLISLGTAVRVHAWQKPEATKGAAPKDEASTLASLVDGRIARSKEVAKDCMVLSYIPDWAFGNVDNIGIANNDGGVRTLVDWADVVEPAEKPGQLKYYLAFYSRKTAAKGKPGTVVAHELAGEWRERTSWESLPMHKPDPVLTAKFEPGEGWKVFDITQFIRDHEGKSGHGLMFRFQDEDRSGRDDDWSGYEFVSREGVGQWAGRRPLILAVEPTKK